MKDIIITPRKLKRELFIWLLCLVAAIGLNVYSIIYYNTNWSELYTHLGYVVAISIVIYLILWVFRGLFLLVRKLKK
jgi:TRAP-type C4-dicarboxylate transport system permease small subunit